MITDSTSDLEVGFLFFPVRLLRAGFDSKEYDILSADGTLSEANALVKEKLKSVKDGHNAGDLTLDVALSERVTPALEAFIKTAFISEPDKELVSTPKQAYFITKNGILRIVGQDRTIADFRSQFRATTFFPGRTYF